MKTPIFDKTGKELKKVDLPADIFDVSWNGDLVHEVVTSMLSNARNNTQHTKNRGDVRGGGKKPWRQKGTGRARVGSIRSPLWRGGGATFGPRNDRNYSKKINKKVRAKAFAIVLSQKARDHEIILVDSLDTGEIKTRAARNIIDSISKSEGLETFKTKWKNAAIIALSGRNDNTEKSFRNIKSMRLDLVQNLNIVDLLNHKYLVIENPETSFDTLQARVSSNAVVEEEPKKKVVKKEKVTDDKK